MNQVRLNDWPKGKSSESNDVSCHIICRNTHASVNLTGVSVFVQQVAKPVRAVGLVNETFSPRGFSSRIGFGKQQEASLKHRLSFCLCGWSENRPILSIQSLLGFLSVKMKLLGKHLMAVPAHLKCEWWHLRWSLLSCSALRALSKSITLPSAESRSRCSQQWRQTNCYLQLSFLPLLIFSLCLLHFSLPCLSFAQSSSHSSSLRANVYISCNRLLHGAPEFILQPVVMARFLDKSWQPLVVDS